MNLNKHNDAFTAPVQHLATFSTCNGIFPFVAVAVCQCVAQTVPLCSAQTHFFLPFCWSGCHSSEVNVCPLPPKQTQEWMHEAQRCSSFIAGIKHSVLQSSVPTEPSASTWSTCCHVLPRSARLPARLHACEYGFVADAYRGIKV